MLRRDLFSTFGVAAGAIAFRNLTAWAADTGPKPPYLITLTDHLGIVFEAEESALKSLLPPKIKPAAGNTVGLNMYQAQTVGLVPYSASYLWINIDGFDSPDGTKGRWMVQGWYGPEPVPTAFKSLLGLPIELGVTRLEHDGNRTHAILSSNGADLIDATIALKEGGPSAVGGVLNLSRLAAKPLRRRRVRGEVGYRRQPHPLCG